MQRLTRLILTLVLVLTALMPAATLAVSRPQVIARRSIFEWFQKPAAVRHIGQHDRTYVSWIAQSGKIQIRYLDNATGAWSSTTTVDNLKTDFGVEAQDDHNAPSLLVLPSGKILIFYAVHDARNNLFIRETARPEDPTAWSARRLVFANGPKVSANYPQPNILADGRLVLFVRIGNWKDATEAMITSADQGQTWSAPRTMIGFGAGTGIYSFTAVRGQRLVVVWNERRNAGRPTNLYYAQSTDNGATWQTSSGRPLALPIVRSTAEAVVRSTEPLYVWDVVIDARGRPRAAYAIGDERHFRYGYAALLGGHWVRETITTSTLLYGGTNYYASGVVIDPADPNRVLLSRQRKTLELELWRRSVTGWSIERRLTANSGVDNFRPQFVAGDKGNRIVWCSGIYDGLVNKQWTGFMRVNIFSAQTKQGRRMRTQNRSEAASPIVLNQNSLSLIML